MEKKQRKFLTVAPFECEWRDDLRFEEAGRGCVAFEAFAHNDVTVVFRERLGSRHYHYKRDNNPHYTVIIGSHRNRRLKIEVDGATAADEAGLGLRCSSAAFQSYWIGVCDGLISIGTGRHPFRNLVFQWLDANPNRSVQYVGLSSWDKHVGYRNVNVLPLPLPLPWRHATAEEVEPLPPGSSDGHQGLRSFLESWELCDVCFLVGDEGKIKTVPAHKVILGASDDFDLSSLDGDVIRLADVTYPVLHAFLRYIYTGFTQISEPLLGSLRALSVRFGATSLAKQCDEIVDRFKLNKKLFDSGKNVEISYPGSPPHSGGAAAFPLGLPVNMERLSWFRSTGKFTDVGVLVDGHGLVARAHKVVLGLWSLPFAKMFTNGMSESGSAEVCLKDVSRDAFETMTEFFYRGELDWDGDVGGNVRLLELLLLADQFGVSLLHQECCKTLLDRLSEGSVCLILRVIPCVPSCKLVRETCERLFTTHFDYCTTADADFVLLDESTFANILQHPELTVTSEERVLNAILTWGLRAAEPSGWEAVDDAVSDTAAARLFGARFPPLNALLPLVRFALLPSPLLKKMETSNLSGQIPVFRHLVKEAIYFLETGPPSSGSHDPKFQHRRSSFKELQYIRDGDSNGLLYFVGTSYGKHQWVNPVLAKKISITASNPISRYTDPKVLASRTYQGTSFAGPRIEDGKNCSWWMVDIGVEHQLMCNYYTLRQDGSKAIMRNWSFQGSCDAANWTNLRVHEKDQTLGKPGQFGSWPVTGPNALLPFRYFRVVLTSPTTDEINPWTLCVCFLELYGYFR